jgi:hypothetical protein
MTHRERLIENRLRRRVLGSLIAALSAVATSFASFAQTPSKVWRIGVLYPRARPTHFHFEVNLKTARALGITIPPTIMVQATRVIE